MLDREDIGLLQNILGLQNNNIDYDLLFKVLTVCKDYPEKREDVLDSFSSNQLNAKTSLDRKSVV